MGLGQLARGDIAGGASVLRASIAPADRDDPRQLHLAGTASIFAGDDRTAFELLQRSVARAREVGAVTSLPGTLTNLAALEVWRADFSAARTLAAEGVDLAGAVGQAQWVAQCTALLAWMAAVQGRHEECERLAREATDLATRHRARSPIALARWARAMLAIGSSRWPDAMTALEAVADERSGDFHPPTAFLSAGDLIETACRVGRPEVALATLAKFEEFASRTTATWASAVEARCRALVSHGGTAAECFEEALAHHAASERRFDEARTHLLYGEHLRRARQRSSARTHLRHALDWFERLGASPWEERALGELRATGETARKREPSALTQLTPQQVQIVNLVAHGATNKDIAGRLFLSPRTVDYHLRNVFVTLGITSRADLIRLASTPP
jgi:DNA-binding NarL/FixJ family response regulator